MISSLQNPKVKAAARLRDRRGRDRTGRFLIEGYRELRRAVENRYPVETVFYCPEWFQGKNESELLEQCRAAGARLLATTPTVFRRIAYRDRPEGLVAVAPQQHRTLDALPAHSAAEPPLYLVAESIEKPGNLGTILRSADAAAVTAVLLCDPCTDLFNPNTVRASIGAVFSVRTVECSSAEARAFLARNGVRLIAATPHSDLVYTRTDMCGPVAIAVGSEQVGLSAPWIDAADAAVQIPMFGQADSLNVAAAAIVLLYEAVRQRRLTGAVP